ncbi:hypothetical protein Dimus_021093 [Dionaea muscipula]
MLARRDLVFKLACREFYRNLTVTITSKKEVAKSSMHGVDIESNSMSFATILGIPGNYGLCDYIKEVWEEVRVFEAFEVPLNDKEGEDLVNTDFYDHTFLNMYQLKRENVIWWLRIGVNKRRDEIENEEAQSENVEMNEEENMEENVVWETENEEEVVLEDVNVENDAQVQGEAKVTEVEVEDSGSGEKFFYDVDAERVDDEDASALAF